MASTGVVPKTCCGRGSDGCVCAAEAKCSCGKNAAMHCDCEKAPTENKISGATCACGQRPAGQCTCSRSQQESTNKVCTCDKKLGTCICGGADANEIDFTGKA